MLNRLYIALGCLLIVLLAAAFLMPRLYDWSSYRERMEQIASEAIGTDVRIQGELSFVLLPQPQMHLSRVEIGPEDDPFISVERIDADLALMQFFRDQYDVEKLELFEPSFHLAVAQDGGFVVPLGLNSGWNSGNMSIKNARLVNGSVLLSDLRTDEHWRLENVNGVLSSGGSGEPFALQGETTYEGDFYHFRVNGNGPDERGDVRLNSFVASQDERLSIFSEGVLNAISLTPVYQGRLRIRMAPQNLPGNNVRGDALLDGKVQLDPKRMRLTEFSVLPDENRAGTRLTGALDLRLGKQRSFDAVISGGVVPLLPQDVLAASDEDPYFLVSLLASLPAPPRLGRVSGRLSVDIADLGLRSASLRNVLVDATTDGENWQIENFRASLAGDTNLHLIGDLAAMRGFASFDGSLTLESGRIDALARAWRSSGDDNPLFGSTASLVGSFGFSSSGATLSNATFRLNESVSEISINWREGSARQLSIDAVLGAFDANQTARLLALLPDPERPGRFETSFPAGTFRLRADRLGFGTRVGDGIELGGRWAQSTAIIEHALVRDIAGARLQGSGSLSGSVDEPVFSGELRADLNSDADSGALWQIVSSRPLSAEIQSLLQANRPARLDLKITPPDAAGAQDLMVAVHITDTILQAEMSLSKGIRNAPGAPLQGTIIVSAPSAHNLATALMLDESLFAPDVPVRINATYQGTIQSSIDLVASVESGEQHVRYAGSLLASEPDNLRGAGKIEFNITDTAPVSDIFGLAGFDLPAVAGRAELTVSGPGNIALGDIVVRSLDEDITGQISLRRLGDLNVVEGRLGASRIDLSAITILLGGRAASLKQDSELWPSGPFEVTATPRKSRGRIRVETPLILADGKSILNDVAFDVNWTPEENRIRNLTGTRGQGEVKADISLCCHGRSIQKQLSGYFSLDGIDLDDLSADAISSRISGVVSASGRFSGLGSDVSEAVSSLGGDGSFAVSNLIVEDFDPTVFETVASMPNVLELEPRELEQTVLGGLKGSPFVSSGVEGLFRLAAGRVLINNISLESRRSKLFGGLSLGLKDFGLQSNWTLSPTQQVGDGSVLSEASARVEAIISGSPGAPEYRIDIQQMVDALQAKALEAEMAELERIRAEQEVRSKKYAEEQQRRMARQAAELAKTEARKAETIARKRAEQAAAAADKTKNSNAGASNETILAPGVLLDLDSLFDPESATE